MRSTRGPVVDRRIALDPTVQPVDGRRLDHRRVALVGQADPVATAVPEHGDGDMVGMHLPVVGDAFVQGEEGVDRALDDEGGDVDVGHQVSRPSGREPGLVGRVDLPRRVRLGRRRQDVRVEGAPGGRRQQQVCPTDLGDARLVQARGEGVPRNGGHDGVDPAVLGGGHPLDPAPVGTAHHAHPRVTRPVELDSGSRRHPVDQPGHVLGLVVGAVDLDRPRRLSEPAGIPGQDVVAGPVEVADRHRAEQVAGAGQIGVTGFAPSRPHEHGWSGMLGCGPGHREPVGTDLGRRRTK